MNNFKSKFLFSNKNKYNIIFDISHKMVHDLTHIIGIDVKKELKEFFISELDQIIDDMFENEYQKRRGD